MEGVNSMNEIKGLHDVASNLVGLFNYYAIEQEYMPIVRNIKVVSDRGIFIECSTDNLSGLPEKEFIANFKKALEDELYVLMRQRCTLYIDRVSSGKERRRQIYMVRWALPAYRAESIRWGTQKFSSAKRLYLELDRLVEGLWLWLPYGTVQWWEINTSERALVILCDSGKIVGSVVAYLDEEYRGMFTYKRKKADNGVLLTIVYRGLV